MTPQDLEGRILLESGTLLVLDKPPGLPSTGRSLTMTTVSSMR